MNATLKGLFPALFLLAIALPAAPARAEDGSDFAPGGTAVDQHDQRFPGLRIVMDLKAKDPANLQFGAKVASNIIQHPGAKLVVVVEGPSVGVFAKKNYLDHQGLVDAWVDLAKKGVKVEYCNNSLHAAGLKPSDMVGLTTENPAVVNPGAFPALARYESLGYAPITLMLIERSGH